MDAEALRKHMAELAAQRDDLDGRAMQLDKEATLSAYTDAGEAGGLLLEAKAKGLREQARRVTSELLDVAYELLCIEDHGDTNQ